MLYIVQTSLPAALIINSGSTSSEQCQTVNIGISRPLQAGEVSNPAKQFSASCSLGVSS